MRDPGSAPQDVGGPGGRGEAGAESARRVGPLTRRQVETARRLLPSGGRSAPLDRLVDLATRLLDAPSAQVSILTDVQTVAAGVGGAAGSVGGTVPLEESLCTVTALSEEALVVPDAPADARVAALPPVATGAVGAYLGVPLRSSAGEVIGALCVHDARSRPWPDGAAGILDQLAASVVTELELAALAADYEVDRGRWEVAIDAAGIGSFDLDVRAGRLRWDGRLLELFGLDPATFDGTVAAFDRRVHPDDLPGVVEARRRAIDGLGAYQAEHRVVDASGRVRWVQARGQVVSDPSGGPTRLIGAALDTTALREQEARTARVTGRAALLGQVTAELGGTLDPVEVATRLVLLVVPALARWCIVSLVDADHEGPLERRVRDVAWWHADPHRLDDVEAYARLRVTSLVDDSFLHRALVTGRRVVISADAARQVGDVLRPGAAREAFLHLAPEAALILPLRAHDRNVGLITLFRDGADGAFSPGDVSTADEAAARAGMALDHARLYALQQDLALGLQRALLTPPARSDIGEVAVRYVPAAETAQVGGDWYDTFEQEPGTTTLVIGDVVGHDTAAAAAMGQLRGLLRGIAATTGEGPAAVLSRLDRAMELLRVDTTATAAVVHLAPLDPPAGAPGAGGTRLLWSNAGHPPPVAVTANGAVTVLRHDDPDLLLGVDPGAVRRTSEVVLGPGTTVLLYTDGLVESRDRPVDDGVAELAGMLPDLAGMALQDLCSEVLARMVPASHQDDDVALVAIRIHARDTAAP